MFGLVDQGSSCASKSVALYGEVVWLTENGVSDFKALHSRSKDDWAMHLAFDILELDGADLRDLPLVERNAA